MNEQMKYNVKMILEREGETLTITDIVEAPFSLEDYIFKHDLEAYNLVDFTLEVNK